MLPNVSYQNTGLRELARKDRNIYKSPMGELGEVAYLLAYAKRDVATLGI